MILPVSTTAGVVGAVVVPPLTYASVLLTMFEYESPVATGATVIETLSVPKQPPGSLALIVALNVPVTDGVPPRTPEELLIERPMGSPVADQVIPLPPLWV